MSGQDEIDNVTEELRQSVIETKSFRQKEKYCVRDFSGEVFELTSDMLVTPHHCEKDEKQEFTGIAECILHKYAKLLAIS